MGADFDSIIDFIVEHIDIWLITSTKFNKQNAKLVVKVQEETREIEKEIFTKNMKMEVIIALNIK